MTNKLEHLAEFREILDNYQVSAAGKRMLAKTKLVLLVGPSSAGRNTIINALLKTGEYSPIISDTTRHPRVNNGVKETNGVEYWFRDEEHVLKDLRQGNFLEAAIIHGQQVSGMSLREIEKIQKEGKVAVNEIEVVGAENIVRVKPDAVVLFVAPPSFEVWMERMNNRGKMTKSEKIRRMESAVREFEAALTKDYYLYMVNDNFESTVEKIHERVLGGQHDPLNQERGRRVIEKLLIQTKNYLSDSK